MKIYPLVHATRPDVTPLPPGIHKIPKSDPAFIDYPMRMRHRRKNINRFRVDGTRRSDDVRQRQLDRLELTGRGLPGGRHYKKIGPNRMLVDHNGTVHYGRKIRKF